MDLFNNKKIKEQEIILNSKRIKIQELNDEVQRLNNEVKKLRTSENSFEKIANRTLKENQKLIEWVKNIIDTVGTIDVRKREHFKIPIYHRCEETPFNYAGTEMLMQEEEIIEIPAITIIRMKMR